VREGRLVDDLAALGPFFAVDSHPPDVEPVPPWRLVSELTAPSEALSDRIAVVRAAMAARTGLPAAEIEPRAAASAVQFGMLARLVAPPLGSAVLGWRLDMRPEGLWWRDETGGPVPLSVPTPSDSYGGPGEWDRRLLDEVIEPVTVGTAQLVPVSGRVLWGNVAAAINAAALQVAAQRPDLAAGAWRAAARLFARPQLATERQPPGPAFRRSSCCLFYRLVPSGGPAALCGNCVLGVSRARSGSTA